MSSETSLLLPPSDILFGFCACINKWVTKFLHYFRDILIMRQERLLHTMYRPPSQRCKIISYPYYIIVSCNHLPLPLYLAAHEHDHGLMMKICVTKLHLRNSQCIDVEHFVSRASRSLT